MTADEKPNPWAEIVGPCYTVASMARTLGWSEDEVLEGGKELRLLMLRTEDDILLFPSFQLHNGTVVDRLTDVLRVLQTGTTDSWTWAQWLNVALPDEDPPRNIQRLYAGMQGASRKCSATRGTTRGRGVHDGPIQCGLAQTVSSIQGIE